MNSTLVKALLAFVPASGLLVYSVIAFAKHPRLPASFQLLGSGCLVIVVLTHVCEALGLFPSMRFGEPDSAGHYIDLAASVLSVILLPAGFLLRRRRRL